MNTTNAPVHQPFWQRILLLLVLAYEGAGALLGGFLLSIAPDGSLMKMPVDIMHGFFPDYFIPGMILIGLGILNTAAFFAVLRRNRFDWLLAWMLLGELIIWFTVEITVLGQLHWLHIMWGAPVLVGAVMAISLIPRTRQKFASL